MFSKSWDKDIVQKYIHESKLAKINNAMCILDFWFSVFLYAFSKYDVLNVGTKYSTIYFYVRHHDNQDYLRITI